MGPNALPTPIKQSPKMDAVYTRLLDSAQRAAQSPNLAYELVASLTTEVGPRIAGSAL